MRIDLLCIGNYNIEHDYIEEFCHYYIDKIGIDVIHLLEDIQENTTNNFDEIPYIKYLIDIGKIDYHRVPHISLCKTYSDFYYDHKNEFDWICVFDCDEYLLLNKHNNIHELFEDKELGLNDSDCDYVYLEWMYYDDNDWLYKPNNNLSLHENYTTYTEYGNIDPLYGNINIYYRKCIVRGGGNDKWINCHCSFERENDEHSKSKHISGQYIGYLSINDILHNDMHDYSVALLNHYRKSIGEFIQRKTNGNIALIYKDTLETLRMYKKEIRYYKWTELKELMFYKAFKKIENTD